MATYKNENCGKKVKGKDGRYLYSGEYYLNGGSDGFIYKNSVAFHEPWRYKNTEEIVYIPEYGFPEKKSERVPEDDLTSYYTRQSLIALTDSEILGEVLFDELTWQSPENLWREWCADSDKNGHWIEAMWAYEKVYIPEFFADIDRKGQAPVCYNEFFDNEWKDDEYRRYCLDKLVENGCMSKEDARGIQADSNSEEME